LSGQPKRELYLSVARLEKDPKHAFNGDESHGRKG